MSKRLWKKTRLARIIWICCLTVFFGSLTAISVFYYYFGDELIGDAVGRVVERTVGYRVYLTGIRLVSPGAVIVEGMDLATGPVVFSSGPAALEFSLGLTTPLRIKKITVRNPSISLDVSREGGGDGDRLIQRIMELDITVENGELVLIDTSGRYVFTGVDMSYEHGIVSESLTIAGSARTEGINEGPMLDGPFYGRMRVTGTYPDVSARGTVRMGESGYRIGDFLFAGEHVAAHIRFDRDTVKATDVSIDGLLISADGRGLTLEGITATGEMEKENDGAFILRDAALAVPRFGDVLLNLTVERNGEWKVTSEADSLMLSSANLRRLGNYVPEFLAGWGITGRAKSLLTMGTVDAGDRSITGNLEVNLVNAGFSSPDSDYLGQGITGSARIQFRDDIREGFFFNGELTAHDFGLLLSGLFVNFEKHRISLKASGRLKDDGGVKNLTGEVSIPSVLSADIFGDIDSGRAGMSGDLSYRMKVRDMAAAYDILFRNYFMNRIPWLYTGAVTGSLNSSGRIGGNLAAPRVSGRLDVAGSTLDFPGISTKVEGISASIPFSFDLADGSNKDATPELTPGDFGEVTVSHAMLGGVDIGAVTLSPALKKNAFALKDTVVVSTAGGSVTIGGVRGENIFDESRTMRLSLAVKGIDIAAVFPREKLVALKGELTGGLAEVRIEGKKLFTSGTLTAKIFNGTVRIDNIWGQDIFDAGRRLGCDVTFADIDLGALTQTIDVGRVTGIAEGGISGLIFSYGGPERFVLDVRTVDRRGVEKRVSVEFVDKLTILGSGSTLFSGLLRTGLNRFVHEYNYSGIGIHLELKNDYFTLRGMIHEGDTEYFIKRSGLTGINVINQNPNNLIRFDDMMRRLERINVKDTEDIRIETR
jgi:hypothetical protein